MNIIVEMIFGSHLYGTSGPNSDTDYKGVFMPNTYDLLLQRVPKSMHQDTKTGTGKNTAADCDKEFYSLHHFLHLACEGETVALDMLHAPPSACIYTSHLWKALVDRRAKFYTKNLRAFVGYARRQAAKYGVKGSRLEEAEKVLEFLRKQSPLTRVLTVWNELPEGEHLMKLNNAVGCPDMYQVCGKWLTANAYCSHYIPMLEGFVDRYGARAQMAKANEGVDWKAVSHAFRAGYQVRHLLVEGDYTYPLPETNFLVQVKRGELDFTTVVGPELDALMDELESLTKQSTLPEKVDRTYWDNWLFDQLEDEIGIGQL
jgi:hypothetical protein